MPIAPLNVSTRSADELAVIRDLGADRLREGLKLIEGSKRPLISPSALREVVTPAVGQESSRVLIKQLMALATFIRRTRASEAETVDALYTGLGSKWDETNLKKWHQVAPIVRDLLALNHVIVTAKAQDIASDFEHVYVESRILTDIRPIFSGLRTEVVGAIVCHRLRVTYHDSNGDHVTLSIALDDADVKELQSACEEATDKAAVAKTLMEKKAALQVYARGEDE